MWYNSGMWEKKQSQQILVVDDSLETIRVVQHVLHRAGFSVMTATSGEEALDLLRQYGLPHLALVDYNMPPGMNGFEFCDQLLQFTDLPIIMLTAVDAEETVVEAIEQYAEDYIIKPFNPLELVARVRRVLQRIGAFPFAPAPMVQVDEYLQVYFARRRLVFEDERTSSLTPTEAKLLYILLRTAGETVSTDYMLRRMWPREIVFDDRLHVHVHRLRSKLRRAKGGLPHDYIISERGVGYRFEPCPELERV